MLARRPAYVCVRMGGPCQPEGRPPVGPDKTKDGAKISISRLGFLPISPAGPGGPSEEVEDEGAEGEFSLVLNFTAKFNGIFYGDAARGLGAWAAAVAKGLKRPFKEYVGIANKQRKSMWENALDLRRFVRALKNGQPPQQAARDVMRRGLLLRVRVAAVATHRLAADRSERRCAASSWRRGAPWRGVMPGCSETICQGGGGGITAFTPPAAPSCLPSSRGPGGRPGAALHSGLHL